MNTKIRRVLFFTLTFVFLFAAGAAIRPLQAMREEYDLSSEPAKGLSPQLALATQVLGWGRGLIIDVIWIRMEGLKRNEKFFELVQLADWACKLAPRFPQVWDIQSWNLAYNVSCKVPHLPDRWAWVDSGIRLLRDQGIPLNPHSAMLYDRLAWIYFHKIGEQDDNAHFFYKQRFGLLMHEALGGEGIRETLQALAAAPRTREELLADKDVNRLWNECNKHGFDIAEGFFEWYKKTASVPDEVKGILQRPHNASALQKLEHYARAKRLRDEYKLDPQRMLALREKYGPFDWRSAFPHAIYWATVGMEKLDELEQRTFATLEKFGYEIPEDPHAEETGEYWHGEEGLYEFRRVFLKRIIYASLQALTQRGRLLFDTRGRLLLEAGADYRFADACLPLYEDVIEAHGMRFKMGTRDAYRSFLKRGILELHLMGDVRKSMDYYKRLKSRFPETVRELTYDEYRKSVFDVLKEDMNTAEARQQVVALIVRGLFALGCNAEDKAQIYEAQAKAFSKYWNDDAEPNLRSRVRYDKLREAVIVDVVTGKLKFQSDVHANLLARLREKNDQVVRKILAKVEATKERLPEVEEVEEKWQKETY
ncbi:MAG: hypothetical protein ACYS1C_05660 [Planctomycetota bacterium]|jgi:hypothetical protein